MIRSVVIAVLLGAGFVIAIPACADEGVGDPCTPEQEYDQTFNGFDEKEVNIESKSFQCRTRICLVNHFRGRVSCPYGQNSDGTPRYTDQASCTVPSDSTKAISGNPADTRKLAEVSPQCVDRNADRAVYCSCRCADINGEKPSGSTFCDCPDGFACTPLVTSIGQGNEGLTGSYCIKNDTKYDPNTACNQGDCDPVAKKCGS